MKYIDHIIRSITYLKIKLKYAQNSPIQLKLYNFNNRVHYIGLSVLYLARMSNYPYCILV